MRKWLIGLAALAMLAVPATAQAREALLASDVGMGDASILVTDDVWWPSQFRVAYEGHEPAEGDVTVWCGLDDYSFPVAVEPGESRTFDVPAGAPECEINAHFSNSDFDHEMSLDAYVTLGSPQINREASERYAATALAEEFSRAYTLADDPLVACPRELAENRRLCLTRWQRGSTTFRGLLAVSIDRIPGTVNQAQHSERIRVRRINWHCVFQRQGAARRGCVHVMRRQSGGPVVSVPD